MRPSKLAPMTLVLLFALPSVAVARDASGVYSIVSTGAGIGTLVVAAALLVVMLSLRRLAEGSAIADNITYAILGVICLATSVLVGWVSEVVSVGFTAEQARLDADLLAIVAMVFLGIYFFRVRRAMSKFLGRLTGQEQNLISVLEPDAELPGNEDGEGV
ncbi:MAG: hypothetical protein CVT66_01360 [Actinobacteria bacterium HGW-Actinobacteria-6]|nr:MAG: hypothetical protein CVT66_01360 [Actinobacteria bacterium HGW-Actinobacteria-6]